MKLRGSHALEMPETFSPPPRISDPDMHHITCMTPMPWSIPGSPTMFGSKELQLNEPNIVPNLWYYNVEILPSAAFIDTELSKPRNGMPTVSAEYNHDINAQAKPIYFVYIIYIYIIHRIHITYPLLNVAKTLFNSCRYIREQPDNSRPQRFFRRIVQHTYLAGFLFSRLRLPSPSLNASGMNGALIISQHLQPERKVVLCQSQWTVKNRYTRGTMRHWIPTEMISSQHMFWTWNLNLPDKSVKMRPREF